MDFIAILNIFLFSLVLLAVIYIDTRKDADTSASTFLFRGLLILSMVAMLSYLAVNSIDYMAPGLANFVSWRMYQVYIVMGVLLSYLLLLYIIASLYEETFHSSKKLLSALFSIPLGLIIAAVLLAPFTGWIFYIDDLNNYHRGDYYAFQYFVAIFYTLISIGVLLYAALRDASYARKKYCIYLLLAIAFPLLGNMVQLLDPDLLLCWPLTTLALLVIYLNMQKWKIANDFLTGLRNKGQFEKYLYDKFQESDPKAKWGLIMIDINDFKIINDTLGHAEGDKVLCYVSDILKKLCDEKGVFLSRYGGDEFAVIFDSGEKFDYPKFLKGLDHAFSSGEGKQTLKYPISLGVGCAYFDPDTIESPQQLIDLADQRMYANKKAQKEGNHG
ncbi:MAG: diguanylate cyclase [Bacillota bacterium]|nr:diguanylate cyclase [Bacillota bacterium]